MGGPAFSLRPQRGAARAAPPPAAPGQSLPQPLEIHRAKRPVVQSIPGAPALAPDHAPVVGAHRPGEANIAQRSEHLAQVHAATCGWVRRLMEAPPARYAHLAAVREMAAAAPTP